VRDISAAVGLAFLAWGVVIILRWYRDIFRARRGIAKLDRMLAKLRADRVAALKPGGPAAGEEG
jgi:hypothetical protein